MAAMNLHEYLSQERGRQASLAKAIGAHAPDISRWADGSRAIPFHFGAPIELATGGQVTRKEMFPCDWERLWPELATALRRTTDPAAALSHPAIVTAGNATSHAVLGKC
jgi:DNA-binding transcriptional regulator YdaS (Cro superfamily)